MSSGHKRDDDKGGYSKHIVGAGVGILAMGLSLATIIAVYLWFGHIGPSYSTSVMVQQQAKLREQYGLPPEPPLSPQVLEVPPSLRNVTGGTEIATNGTSLSTSNGTAAANANTSANNVPSDNGSIPSP